MAHFTGVSIQNVTKVKQSDVFINVQQTVVAMVTVPQTMIDVDGAMPLATLLTSTDGGVTWNPLTTTSYVAGSYDTAAEVYFEGAIYSSDVDGNLNDPSGADWTKVRDWNANGVLYNDLTESKKTTVVVTGIVKAKYLGGNDSFLQATLFNNKIIAK